MIFSFYINFSVLHSLRHSYSHILTHIIYLMYLIYIRAFINSELQHDLSFLVKLLFWLSLKQFLHSYGACFWSNLTLFLRTKLTEGRKAEEMLLEACWQTLIKNNVNKEMPFCNVWKQRIAEILYTPWSIIAIFVYSSTTRVYKGKVFIMYLSPSASERFLLCDNNRIFHHISCPAHLCQPRHCMVWIFFKNF